MRALREECRGRPQLTRPYKGSGPKTQLCRELSMHEPLSKKPKTLFLCLSKAMARSTAIVSTILLTLLLPVSCVKEIDIDAPSDTGELVIEAYYFGEKDSAVARISRTVGYFSSSLPPSVSNALVILEEVETGAKDTLRWRDSVYLRTQGTVTPTTNHHYRLKVQVENETILSGNMPLLQRVPIIALIDTFLPARGPIPEGYRIIGISQDPPGEAQGYRLRVWKNDTLLNKLREWIYSDDRYIDGRPVLFELPFEANPNDSFYVELWTMPRSVIRFYDQLVRNAFGGSGGFSPPPDNATSNFSGNKRRVWGYFTTIDSDGRGVRVRPQR